MSIVNHTRLFGETFASERVVDKILVSVPEKYESKISSLEDSKDLSKISLVELVNSLSALDQRRFMREEENGGKIEGLLLAKSSFAKATCNKVQCNHCHKITKKRTAGTKKSHNASNTKDMGTWKRIVDFKVMKKSWHN